jgi:hypothetical protein
VRTLPSIPLTTVAFGLALSGCGSAPAQHEFTNNFAFASVSSDDAFWTATRDALASLRLPVESADREAGTMSTGWVGLPEEALEYADCGSAGFAHSFRNLETNVKVLVAGSTEKQLTVHTQFRADKFEGGLAQKVREEDRVCFSTGLLEDKIRAAVQQRLGGAE